MSNSSNKLFKPNANICNRNLRETLHTRLHTDLIFLILLNVAQATTSHKKLQTVQYISLFCATLPSPPNRSHHPPHPHLVLFCSKIHYSGVTKSNFLAEGMRLGWDVHSLSNSYSFLWCVSKSFVQGCSKIAHKAILERGNETNCHSPVKLTTLQTRLEIHGWGFSTRG